jgi:hypothetical protein
MSEQMGEIEIAGKRYPAVMTVTNHQEQGDGADIKAIWQRLRAFARQTAEIIIDADATILPLVGEEEGLL